LQVQLQEQLQREAADERRSRDAARTQDRRLAERQQNSRRGSYKQLYSLCVTPLAQYLAVQFETFAANPRKAGPHYKVLPLFDCFPACDYIAVVALRATLDRMSRPLRIASFCQAIGSEIERESKALQLQQRSPLLGPQLMRRAARLKQSRLPSFLDVAPSWDDRSRLEVGLFLLDAIVASCGLVELRLIVNAKRKSRWVFPTAEAEALIAGSRPLFRMVRRPMTCRPNPWTSVDDGGYLSGSKLVRANVLVRRDEDAMDPYRAADMGRVMQAVNRQQEISLTVNADMVRLQREAWDAGIAGLWPCPRVPIDVPERLPMDAGAAEIKARNRLAAMAHREREENRSLRIRIERRLQAAEELAGRTIWQAYELDFRGRLYTVSTELTHQGPDHEKALLDFADAQPASEQGFEWLLRSAATHWGLRSTWGDRLRWGLENKQRMLAVAEDPLNRVELWRSAKDPWQFLQLAKAVAAYCEDSSTPIGCPVRFDQTNSGCGILAALVRDQKLARQTNLCGSTPMDLYSIIAESITQRLKADLHTSPSHRTRASAELWLERGVRRDLIKPSVVAWPFGGSYVSAVKRIAEQLDSEMGYVPIDEYTFQVYLPSKYMAFLLSQELKERLSTIAEPRAWMRKCVRKVMLAGHHASWIGPTGFPIVINDRGLSKYSVTSKMNGFKIAVTMQDLDKESSYNPTQANKGIGANLIHSLDAAFCQLVILGAGRLMPLLTNHDCFATTAANAQTLHFQLLLQMRELYMTNWLHEIRNQLTERTRVKLPAPPAVSTLCPSQIGTNPYLFS
jgi:DNA-directed RNA polymerase